jgi:hypothetical protein
MRRSKLLPPDTKKGIRYKDYTSEELDAHWMAQQQAYRQRVKAGKAGKVERMLELQMEYASSPGRRSESLACHIWPMVCGLQFRAQRWRSMRGC